MFSFFALFKRSNPVLPVVAPPATTPRSCIAYGAAAAWNALLSLLILFISLLGSLFSTLAGSFERLATIVDGFRVVLSVERPSAKVTPESFNPIFASIAMPPPAFNPAYSYIHPANHGEKGSLGQLTPRRLSHSSLRLPTYEPQPATDIDSSLQLAVALQILSNVFLKPEENPKFTFRTILVDKVPIGFGLLPPELGPVFKTTKHMLDIISDQDKYGHLVYGDADPARRRSVRSSVPRVEVSLPGPIKLDTSSNASQVDVKPMDLSVLGLPLDQDTTLANSEPRSSPPNLTGLADDTLDTTLATEVHEENSRKHPLVLVLPPPGNDTSMDTSSSDDSILPTPIDPKFPAHVAEPHVVTPVEASPVPVSPSQFDSPNSLAGLPQLPSSVTLLVDSWNPPSPFVYTAQSPSQGTTRPIVPSRAPSQVAPQQSLASNSLRHIGSSVSLLVDAWSPPSQFVYEGRTPPMNSTQPIVPRNKRRDFQVCPGDLVSIPTAPTKDTNSIVTDGPATINTNRSMKRRAMVFDFEKPVGQLVSSLRKSVSASSHPHTKAIAFSFIPNLESYFALMCIIS
ncbi:hypothetical protein FRC12_024610 [Ceratobasidium sp. 428]|nr:hypothetical protein FRC12_024610 [Ceratobasidium sp. 428]